ncbi:MAG: phospholipase domain-containing protein [Nocardioidaceae bacterium]
MGPRRDALWLTLTQDGPGSAPVVIFPYAGEFTAPEHLEFSGTLDLYVPTPQGRYDVVVVGTNGMRREHRGVLTHEMGAHVTSTAREHTAELLLTLHNHGAHGLNYTVTPRDYAAEDTAILVHVGPQATQSVAWSVSRSYGWYDLAVSVAEDPTFARRLTGHFPRGHQPAS